MVCAAQSCHARTASGRARPAEVQLASSEEAAGGMGHSLSPSSCFVIPAQALVIPAYVGAFLHFAQRTQRAQRRRPAALRSLRSLRDIIADQASAVITDKARNHAAFVGCRGRLTG